MSGADNTYLLILPTCKQREFFGVRRKPSVCRTDGEIRWDDDYNDAQLNTIHSRHIQARPPSSDSDLSGEDEPGPITNHLLHSVIATFLNE